MMHGAIPPQRFFPYLRWPDIAAFTDPAEVIIIQPIGAIEQHGPHLPLVVDSAIATGVIGGALAQLDPAIPAYALPPLCYGKSNEHWRFPGTVTLTATTLLTTLQEVAESLYQAGFRKFVLANAHGGQPQVLEIAARDLHQRHPDFMVFPLGIWSVPNCAAELVSPQELAQGIHAGALETSLMLALLPDQVRLDLAKAEYPRLPPTQLLSMEGALPFAWSTHDLSTSGTLGDPTSASREQGEQLLASLMAGWVQVLGEIHQFRQPTA